MPASTDVVYKVQGYENKVYFSDEALAQAVVAGQIRIHSRSKVTRYIMTNENCAPEIVEMLEGMGAQIDGGIGRGNFPNLGAAERSNARKAFTRLLRRTFIR